MSWKAALAVAVAGFGFHALNDFRPVDSYFPPADEVDAVGHHFAETYYEARALFRQRAGGAGAVLHTLPLPHLKHLDLSIDVAVIPGRKDSLFLHLSGTHGVEGFTGSAIQSAILSDASNLTSNDGPTVVLVHAVNPYGFSQLRRVNENNVDLNRNWLSHNEFAELKAADPNSNGYVDFYDLLNPVPLGAPWLMHFKFLTTLIQMATRGFDAFKTAMVSATYRFSQGIFFGGFEKQPSLVILEQFLNKEIGIDTMVALTIVDVHTGLGPSGVDTLILTPTCDVDTAERVFVVEKAAGLVASTKASSNAVTKGYAATRGYVNEGISALIPQKHRHKIVSVAQEFGTVPLVFVTKALVEENAYYQHAPTRRLPVAEKLRDVFYVHQSAFWKKNVIARGLDVFKKLYSQASA